MVARLYLMDQGLSFTGKAIETISGGQIVRAVSGATVLTTTNQLTDVIEVALADAAVDSNRAVGIAINTGVSGDRIGVATAGVHGLYAAGVIEPGSIVFADGAVATADAVNTPGATSNSGHILRFGRALSMAASGQLVAVLIGPA